MKTYTTTVYEFGPDNDLILKLPDEMIEELDWYEGDVLIWTDNKDGSFTIERK